MEGRHSDLVNEFPEHKDAILALKKEDPFFLQLCHSYEEVDVAVTRAENGLDRMSLEDEEELKMKRAKLKDKLYSLIRKQ